MRKEKLFFLSVMAALFLSACGEKEAAEISETTETDTAIVEEVVSVQEMSQEKWSYSEETPFFQEVGEYEVNFNFNQNGEKRTMRFDTHDTGTMSLRED